MISKPVSVATGVSTVPSTCVAVLCVGDAAMEVNELDLEWSNIYDGDTYVSTRLRVVALAMVPTDHFHKVGVGPGVNVGKFIQTILSQAYTSTNHLNHITRPNAEVLHSYRNVDMNKSSPSSMALDSATDYVKATGIPFSDVIGGNRGDAIVGSTVCIPPANFAIIYKPSIMSGLTNPIPAVSHHPVPALSGSGVIIPSWAMFRPIDVELVSLDSSIGNDMAALRVIISVYFNMSSISPSNPTWHEPAYHKWSVSSHWVVGNKPRIVVNGRLVRRTIVSGAPSLWEWLPRTMPGMHLVQLDTASDHDGKTTSYNAVYEIDFVIPLFTSDGALNLSQQMATSSFFMAYYSIQESATTLVNGGVALETAFETQLQRAQTEGAFVSSIVSGMAALAKQLGGTAMSVSSSGSVRRDSLKRALAAAPNMALDVVNEAIRQQAAGVSRFATNKAYDLNALQRIGNSVERTVTIDVMGYPGVPVDTLQVAAFTIAKQVFFGWLTMALPPLMRFGWLVKSVLKYEGATELVRSLLTEGANVQSAINAAVSGSGGVISSAVWAFSDSIIRYFLGVNPPFRWSLFQPVGIDLNNFDQGWNQLMDNYLAQMNSVFTYCLPRRFPGMILNNIGVAGIDVHSSLSVDDVLSTMLAGMGIHSITTNVTVDHTIPLVRLTLTAIFKTVEYSGNTILHSIWRVFGNTYAIKPYEEGGGAKMPSLSTMVPAILPLMTAEGFHKYRNELKSWWAGGLAGPQKVLASDDARISTFAHIVYDDKAINDPRRTDLILGTHQLREQFSHSIYAHGGSIGTGYVTPTVVPSYSRPNLPNYYASGLGAGVALWYLNWHMKYGRNTIMPMRHAETFDGLRTRTNYR